MTGSQLAENATDMQALSFKSLSEKKRICCVKESCKELKQTRTAKIQLLQPSQLPQRS
jgi:hypothetical protein